MDVLADDWLEGDQHILTLGLRIRNCKCKLKPYVLHIVLSYMREEANGSVTLECLVVSLRQDVLVQLVGIQVDSH